MGLMVPWAPKVPAATRLGLPGSDDVEGDELSFDAGLVAATVTRWS